MLVIGNIISFVASMFLLLSCVFKKRNLVFLCQFFECSLLALASIFFESYAGMTTLILCATRNIVIAKDKYTNKIMWLFLVLTAFFGVLSNNRGVVGLLPVIATIFYTLSTYLFKGIMATKVNIFINTFLWVVYSVLIKDYSTTVSNSVVLITVSVSMLSMVIANKKYKILQRKKN